MENLNENRQELKKNEFPSRYKDSLHPILKFIYLSLKILFIVASGYSGT